jgi:hypothetical protein
MHHVTGLTAKSPLGSNRSRRQYGTDKPTGAADKAGEVR